jgi:hypothetical protein
VRQREPKVLGEQVVASEIRGREGASSEQAGARRVISKATAKPDESENCTGIAQELTGMRMTMLVPRSAAVRRSNFAPRFLALACILVVLEVTDNRSGIAHPQAASRDGFSSRPAFVFLPV